MSHAHRDSRCWLLRSMVLTIVACAASLALAPAPRAQVADEVWDYAGRCYTTLGIAAGKLDGPFDCMDGELLPTHVEGILKDLGGPAPAANFPSQCDYPAWLWLSPNHCYGHSRIQMLDTETPKVKAALLCRHKKDWSDVPEEFDDIAMIVHNRSNGETCWFQTNDSGAPANYQRDGTMVPGPRTVTDHKFWMKPTLTKSVNCITCHDSGPFLNSRWIDNAINAGPPTMKDGKGKYKNSEAPFDTWPQPKFVTVARAGMNAGGEQCSRCHKIAAKGSFGGRAFGTCTEWINNTVGRSHFPNPPSPGPLRHDQNAPYLPLPHPAGDITTVKGESFSVAYWMPKGHGETSVFDWVTKYDDHVEKVIDCCEAVGDGIAPPAGCKEYDPEIRVSGIPTLPTAQVAGSFDGGLTFPVGAMEPWEEEPIPYEVAPGTEITLMWGSPPELEYCALEATFPEGVSVDGISTASNFSLNDGYPYMRIGYLVEAGTYRFDLLCDEDGEPRGASISFSITPTAVPGLSPWLIAPLVALFFAIAVRMNGRRAAEV